MRFTPIGEMELTYVAIDFVDYGVGGQFYGVMEGQLRTDRVTGRVKLTNFAQKRSDDVNTPALRGLLETEDGARVFVEMNGLAQIQQGGRVFITSLTFRTSDARYERLNTLFAVLEGELHGRPRAHEMHARCRVYACDAEITPSSPGDGVSPVVIAYALPADQADAALTGSRGEGTLRAAAFRQRGSTGDLVLVYREIGGEERAGPPVRAELLIRQPPPRPGPIYLMALPLAAGAAARFHELCLDLNGIHAAEFEESLRRFGVGITVFLQHRAEGDLLVVGVQGDDPATWLERLGRSADPFDRWLAQQLGDHSGVEISTWRSSANEELWSWGGEPESAKTKASG